MHDNNAKSGSPRSVVPLNSEPQPITVLLVEDHSLVREGMKNLLANTNGIDVVGDVSTGEEAIDSADICLPDIMLIDIRLPKMTGIDLLKIVVGRFPKIQCVMLSAYSDPLYVSKALEAGAHGYLLKTVSSAELIDAIRSVASGSIVIDNSLAQILPYLGRDPHHGFPEPLTPREKDVLFLLTKGYSNKQVASKLNICLELWKAMNQSFMQKLGVNSRTKAVIYAIEHHLTMNTSSNST